MQAAAFITSSSGFPPANNNLYYTSFWSSTVVNPSPRATNADDSQAQFVRNGPSTRSGSTRLDLALADQQAVWSMPPGVPLLHDDVAISTLNARCAAQHEVYAHAVWSSLYDLVYPTTNADAMVAIVASRAHAGA